MPSGRRDITIFATVIFVIILLFSFRSIFTEHNPWRRPASAAPTFGSGKPKAQPTRQPAVPPQKEKENSEPAVVKTTSSITSTSSSLAPSATSAEPLGVIGSCEGFPDTKDILVVLKTGATEAYDKLPIHFLTTLSCNNDSILFSDMDMNVAGHHVIDSLDEIAEDIMKDNSDFELYKQLQEYHDLHEDPRPLKIGSNGWNLDKYKFIHMLLKTYRYRPDVPWYVFIEADTALIWDNLRTFLDKYDPNEPYYIGSPTYLDIEFAHGGTGYVISGAAMKKAVGNHMDIDKKYDKEVHGICCGDAMIGRVLLDEKIKLTKAWPIFNGEKPLTLPFSKSHWCQPVITMHHLTAQEVSQVWNFENERKAKGITVRSSIPYHSYPLQRISTSQEPSILTSPPPRPPSSSWKSSNISSTPTSPPTAPTGTTSPPTSTTPLPPTTNPTNPTTAANGASSPTPSAPPSSPPTTATKRARRIMTVSSGCIMTAIASCIAVFRWGGAIGRRGVLRLGRVGG